MQTHENVEVPQFLSADFVVQYSGRNVPSVGLMCGDVLCLCAVKQAQAGRLVIARDGDQSILGILRHIASGIIAIQPLDSAYPSRIFVEGKDDPPRIVGEVTGWIHSVMHKEADQEGDAGL